MHLSLLAIAVSLAAVQTPKAEELGPTQKNGTVNSRASMAGLCVNLAGDDRELYVVSLNSGVWKSIQGQPWTQLANSPACAWCIAVDPTNRRHVAVGERNGLARDVRLNRNGLWESSDAGKTWRYTFDPLSLPGCKSQAIPSVAFGADGALYIGTCGGVGRRGRGAKSFEFRQSPPGIGLVTAVTVSEHRVWARSRTHLLTSTDGGNTWTAKPFPTEINGSKITFTSRGDAFALGATDDLAYTPFIPVPTPDNRNNILYYDVRSDRWMRQVLDTGNGTGLGGRRFAKSFVLRAPKLKDEIGQRIQLFVGVGQEIHQALGRNPDGTLRWDTAIQSRWGGPYNREPNDIHPDTWDLAIPPDYDPSQPLGWVACDGGVYRCVQAKNGPKTPMWRMNWVTQNNGLLTHHAHTITVLPMPGAPSRLAYPTADNDGWSWDSVNGWLAELYMGDVNFTVGDAANPSFAVLWRNIALGMCTAFGAAPPSGAGFKEYDAIMLNPQLQFDGPYAFNLIQTLKSEAMDYPLGDALLLATPPLKTYNKAWKLEDVPGPLGKEMGGPVILRNRKFAGSPDANVSRFQTWEVFAKDLPRGAQGFWVGGGHRNPMIVLAAVQDGKARLFRGHGGDSPWEEIGVRNGRQKVIAMIDQPLDRLVGGGYDRGLPPLPWASPALANEEDEEPALGSMHGPVFLNPFDPDRLFVLSKNGVWSSYDGGKTFAIDATLTALVTGSGMYPIATGNLSGNAKDVVLAGRENSMATLTHMAFLRDDPKVVVASSPFCGVFLSLDSGRTWKDLTPCLPTPRSAVPSVGIDSEAVYAIPYSRSVVRVTGYRQAREAAFFEWRRSAAKIVGGDGKPIARGRVSISILDSARKTRRQEVVAGGDGLIKLPPGGEVVELRFGGDLRHAPAVSRSLVDSK